MSAISKTGAMLGLRPVLPDSEGRDRVRPLEDLQLVSCKSIATVPVGTGEAEKSHNNIKQYLEMGVFANKLDLIMR